MRWVWLPGAANAADIQRLRQAFDWGEPYYEWLDDERLCAALPVGVNQVLEGGVLFEFDRPEEHLLDARKCVETAWKQLQQANCVNQALMRERAKLQERERAKAQVVHATKAKPSRPLRELYWELEPELFIAMRRGDRKESRRLLNQVLLAIYSFGEGDLVQTKGLLIDLVTIMTRTLAEGTSDPESIFSLNHELLTELNRIEDEEALSSWVGVQFERLMDTVVEVPVHDEALRMELVLNWMREHCDQELTRDGVAKRVGLSPGYFSERFLEHTGHSFSEHLSKLRVDKAARLLRSSNHTLLSIALECGFADASYFSKVFRKVMGQSPSAFRSRRKN